MAAKPARTLTAQRVVLTDVDGRLKSTSNPMAHRGWRWRRNRQDRRWPAAKKRERAVAENQDEIDC